MATNIVTSANKLPRTRLLRSSFMSKMPVPNLIPEGEQRCRPIYAADVAPASPLLRASLSTASDARLPEASATSIAVSPVLLRALILAPSRSSCQTASGLSALAAQCRA